MGKYLIFLSGILLVLIYLYATNPKVRHYYHLFLDKNEIYNEKIIYKKLRNAKDLNGKYIFSINYPEIYTLGIEIKDNNLNLNGEKYNWIDNPPIRVKIEIITKTKEIIYSEIINKFKTMSLTKNGNIQYDITHILLSKCKDCILNINLQSGDFLEYENTKDILNFYFSPSGYI